MHEGFPGKVENCGQGSSSTFTLITRTASGRPKLKQRHYHWNWNAVGLSYRKNRSYHIRDFCVCGLGSDLVSPTEGTQTNGHSSCCLYQLAATRQRPRHSLAHSFIHSLTGPLRHVSVQVGLARLSLRSSWWVSTHTHSPIHPPTSITPIGLVLWRALALWLHGCAFLLSPGKAIVCVRKYWVCAWKISYLNNNSIFIYFHLCCEVELVFFLNQSHVLLLSFYWFCVAATPVTWLWIDSRVIHFSPLLTAPLAGCVFFIDWVGGICSLLAPLFICLFWHWTTNAMGAVGNRTPPLSCCNVPRVVCAIAFQSIPLHIVFASEKRSNLFFIHLPPTTTLVFLPMTGVHKIRYRFSMNINDCQWHMTTLLCDWPNH